MGQQLRLVLNYRDGWFPTNVHIELDMNDYMDRKQPCAGEYTSEVPSAEEKRLVYKSRRSRFKGRT